MWKYLIGVIIAVTINVFDGGAQNKGTLWIDSMYNAMSDQERMAELLWVKSGGFDQKISENSFGGFIVRSSDIQKASASQAWHNHFTIGFLDPKRVIDHPVFDWDSLALECIRDTHLMHDYGLLKASYFKEDLGLDVIVPLNENSDFVHKSAYLNGISKGIFIFTDEKTNVIPYKNYLAGIADISKHKRLLRKGKIMPSNLVISSIPTSDQVEEQYKSGVDIFEVQSDSFDLFLTQIKEVCSSRNKMKRMLEGKVKKVLALKYSAQLIARNPEKLTLSPEEQKYPYLAGSIVTLNNNAIPIADIFDKKIAYYSKDPSFYDFLDRYVQGIEAGSIEALDQLQPDADIVVIKYDKGMSIEWLKKFTSQTTTILVVTGSPEQLKDLSGIQNIIWLNDTSEAGLDLISQVIYGARPSTGMLPVTISEDFKRGDRSITADIKRLRYDYPVSVGLDTKKLLKIDAVINDAVKTHATPGGQILIAKNRKIIYNKSFGFQTYDSLFAVNHNTLYDLASITKVLATTVQIMSMYESMGIDLQDSIGTYLSDMDYSDKGGLKISDLLLHQSGLRSYYPFWKNVVKGTTDNAFHASINSIGAISVHSNFFAQGYLRDSLYQWLSYSPLRQDRNANGLFNYSYSDLGFMLLSKVIETNYNTSLDVLCNRFFYTPLGMSSTYFQPWKYYSLEDIAPTEMDTPFRGELIRGWVHDRNASLLGGVSGHAGLFSNANDLAKMAQMFLNGGYYGGRRYFKPETIDQFTCQQDDDNRRGLGWDKSGHFYSINNTSKHASSTIYGHTGFTGTAIWMDPSQELIYIFLSNRVYPEATNSKLQELNTRTKIHDIVYEAIRD